MRRGTDRGAAMIVAIVVSMVIMIFSLSLLLVTYSLYASVQKNTVSMQCRELAASLSAEVGQEIMGSQEGNASETPLYSYLRAFLWQDVWPYYDPEDMTEQEECYKYFSMEIPAGYEDMADQIRMTLYWTIEEAAAAQGGQTDEASCAVLHVRIRVSKNETSYVTEKAYVLHVSRDTDEEQLADSAFGTKIDINEHWSFSDWWD